jgi:hypothetical protein
MYAIHILWQFYRSNRKNRNLRLYKDKWLQDIPLKSGPFARRNQDRILFHLVFGTLLQKMLQQRPLWINIFFARFIKNFSRFRRASGPVLSGILCVRRCGIKHRLTAYTPHTLSFNHNRQKKYSHACCIKSENWKLHPATSHFKQTLNLQQCNFMFF